jgi:hypothetical protein
MIKRKSLSQQERAAAVRLRRQAREMEALGQAAVGARYRELAKAAVERAKVYEAMGE